MDNTRENLIKNWKNEDIRFFEETIWTSSIQQFDLQKVRDFLELNNFHHTDISIVRPRGDELSRIKWKYHYDESGNCISTGFQNVVPKDSNHLKLIIGLDKRDDNQELQSKTINIINLLRVIFGVPIARELVLINLFDMSDSIGKSQSEQGFASYFQTQSLNMQPDISEAKVKIIPIEACILLDKALSQKYPTECFILMWTAFESIINHIETGKDNGTKRANYFKKLGSELVNNEVFRLFKDIRCNIFKEANSNLIKDIEKENWSLYCILQLTIMEECSIRTKFLKGYESFLESNKSI